MSKFKETFKGNGAVAQAVLETGALVAGTVLGAAALSDKTSLNITLKQALAVSSALGAIGAVHGFAKGAAAEAQFNEQNTLINEAVHKGYIEESVEKVSHKVR
jgi:hypothetical protein